MAKIIPLDKASEDNHTVNQISSLNLGSTDLLNEVLSSIKEASMPRYIKFEFRYLPDFLVEVGSGKESKASRFFKEVFQPKAYVLLRSGNAYMYDFKENKMKKITPDIRIFQPSKFQKMLSSPITLMAFGAITVLTLAFAVKGLRDTLRGE